MPRPDSPPAEILCIVDRSGSMDAIRGDAVGGFNAFVRAQRELPGDARLTLVLFDDAAETVHARVPLADVPELTDATYRPSGRTALHDALGSALHRLRAELAGGGEAPRVVVAVLTDGEENASREFSARQAADAVSACRADGWEFVFLAANQDATLAAQRVGIPHHDAMPFVAEPGAAGQAFVAMSRAVADRRA